MTIFDTVAPVVDLAERCRKAGIGLRSLQRYHPTTVLRLPAKPGGARETTVQRVLPPRCTSTAASRSSGARHCRGWLPEWEEEPVWDEIWRALVPEKQHPHG